MHDIFNHSHCIYVCVCLTLSQQELALAVVPDEPAPQLAFVPNPVALELTEKNAVARTWIKKLEVVEAMLGWNREVTVDKLALSKCYLQWLLYEPPTPFSAAGGVRRRRLSTNELLDLRAVVRVVRELLEPPTTPLACLQTPAIGFRSARVVHISRCVQI